MRRVVRFAPLLGLSAAMALFALDPPHKPDPTNRQTQDRQTQDQQTSEQKKSAEYPKKEVVSKDAASGSRLDRRGSRMKERDRQIDDMVNRQKK